MKSISQKPVYLPRREFLCGFLLVSCTTSSIDMGEPMGGLDRSGGSSKDYNAGGVVRSNFYREKAGLKPLSANSICTRAAMEHAMNMAITGTMDHWLKGVGPNGDIATRMKNFKVPLPHAENVSYGYGNVERAVDAWYESPGHRKNLMNTKYRYVGIAGATHPNSNNKIYWCSVYSA